MFQNNEEEEVVVEVEEEIETEEKEDEVVEPSAREKSLEAEVAKYKRIAEQKSKKLEQQGTATKSDGFGLDVKGYLKSSGINSSEFDFVKSEMKTAGITDVDELLDNEYFKAKLEKHRESVKTQEAVPAGKRSGGNATGSVEYWATKDISEVPADMRLKVVNARLHKENTQGVFYNS